MDSFVIRTQQHRERWAAENIFRAGYSYYLPQVVETVRVVRRGVRRREYQVKPLFPSYIFVSADRAWHSALVAFGVVGIVPGTAGAPAIIRAPALRAIQAMEQDGIVHLPKLSLDVPRIKINAPARITSGAYAGFAGIVEGISANDRVQVLLDYMGRKVPFIVREANLEQVDTTA